MLDYKESAELNSCTINELKKRFKRFPQSHKIIVAYCDNCGRRREIEFRQYVDLCLKCSLNTSEHLEIQSRKSIEYWSDQENRDRQSKKRKQYYINHPETKIEHSEYMHKYYEDLKHREEASERTNKYFKNHPEATVEHSKKLIIYYENPKHCGEASERCKQAHKDHPEYGEQHSIRMKDLYDNDPTRAERISAQQQDQDYDSGEWTGFVDNLRPYLVPKNHCIHLNPKFEGCIQHHIMTGVIINILPDLHRSINHRMTKEKRKGKNMKKINKLSFKFLMGDII